MIRSSIREVLGIDRDYTSVTQRTRHTYVIGQPGMGKTRALESWVMQDIAQGHGVGVIDPHGDLFQRLVIRLVSMPKAWDRLVILDPCNPRWTVCFNPLEAIQGVTPERLSLFMTDVIVKIWKLDSSSSPRMIWLLTNTFLALSGLGLTLLDLPRFLLDGDFRDRMLPRLSNETARSYFQFEFPKSQAAVHQWVTPVLNKIGGLIFDPDLRLMFSGQAKLNFREVLDNQMILLVNLPKGILGEGASALLGAFIVAYFQKAALSRADTYVRPPFYLYLDEFQNYTTDNIQDILSESRKYALSLILAHQYLEQLSVDLRNAVLNTAGTLACFRVGYQDAYQLAKEIFPSPDFLSTSEAGLKFNHPGRFKPLTSLILRQKSLGWEGLAQALTQLPSQTFWCRRRGSLKPIRLRAIDMPDPLITSGVKAGKVELLNFVGSRFGRLTQDLRGEYSGYSNDGVRPVMEDADGSDPSGSIWSR